MRKNSNPFFLYKSGKQAVPSDDETLERLPEVSGGGFRFCFHNLFALFNLFFPFFLRKRIKMIHHNFCHFWGNGFC